MNVREMYNYGYKWTGMIPLTAEEARNLFLNDSIQIYRLYQDNSHEDIMIGQGWFVRKHTTDFMEALQTLDDKEKADGR